MDDEDKMEDSTAGPIESRQIVKVSLMFNYNTIWLYCYYSFCVLPEPNWNTLNFLFINADCMPWNWQGEFIKTKCRFFQMLFTQEDCAIAMQKGSFWRHIVLFDNWKLFNINWHVFQVVCTNSGSPAECKSKENETSVAVTQVAIGSESMTSSNKVGERFCSWRNVLLKFSNCLDIMQLEF